MSVSGRLPVPASRPRASARPRPSGSAPARSPPAARPAAPPRRPWSSNARPPAPSTEDHNTTSWSRTDQWTKVKVGAKEENQHVAMDTVKNGSSQRCFGCHCQGIGQAAEARVGSALVTISLCCMRSSATSFCAIVSSCAFRSSSVCRHSSQQLSTIS